MIKILSCTILWVLTMAVSKTSAMDTTFDSSPFSKNAKNELKAKVSDKRMYLLWDIQTTAESYSSEIDNAFFFEFKTTGEFKYRILKQLELDVKANVLFQGGQAQSRFGDLLPSGPAYLSYGFLSYDVMGDETLKLKAGALSQFEFFGNNLFIARRAFPGISENFQIKNEDLSFSLSAQQVVPTTYTFSNALIEREPTPRLNTVKANFGYDYKKWNFGLSGGVFDYSRLPAYVADASRLFGNSVMGTGFASEFLFDYRGWITNIDVVYNASKNTSFKFNADMLENTDAPRTYNQAQIIQIEAHRRWSKNMGFDAGVSNFFIESDAVPAFFTSRIFGQTNRRGYTFEFGVQWIEQKVRVSGGYTVSNLINPDPTERQLNNDVIFVNVETAYDLFN